MKTDETYRLKESFSFDIFLLLILAVAVFFIFKIPESETTKQTIAPQAQESVSQDIEIQTTIQDWQPVFSDNTLTNIIKAHTWYRIVEDEEGTEYYEWQGRETKFYVEFHQQKGKL